MNTRSKYGIEVLVAIAACCFLTSIAALILYAWQFSGQSLSTKTGDWGVFGDFVGGVLNPLLAVINISVVVFIAYELHELESRRESEAAKAEESARNAAEDRARHDRVIALHEYYLSPEFFSKVRAPAYQVGLTWTHLPEPQRAAYREAVTQGWAFEVGEDKLDLYVPRPPENPEEVITSHFQTPKGLPSLTEHQALTALLRFWTRIRILIDLNMIDRHLVRSLFKDEFGYELSFFQALSAAVTQRITSKAAIPRWVDDLQYLEKVFCS